MASAWPWKPVFAPSPPNLGGNRAAPPELGAGGRAVGGAVAEELFEHGLCLPSGTAMSERDPMRVVDVIRTQINRTQMNGGHAHG